MVRWSLGKKLAIWASALVLALGIAGAVFLKLHSRKPELLPPVSMDGSVLKNDPDPQKQQPIADVTITAVSGSSFGETKSNELGFFRISIEPGVKKGAPITFYFRHPDYKPAELQEKADGQIVIGHLTPLHEPTPETPKGPLTEISNIVVRYSIQTTTEDNTGSAVRTFQVVNKGNVPCNGQVPCSPGSKWKAAVGGITLDAGVGNRFHNARVSCISGPCAFTRILSNSLSDDGRKMTVSAIGWSDTTTFLVEAEVVHPMVSDVNLDLYPVIFGRALNFNLPPEADGLSIEANVNKEPVVFPIGPDLCLSWANCKVSVAKDQTKSYRCELKQGYEFAK